MIQDPIRFFAPGIPRPGGSKKGFYSAKLKRVLIVDASKNVAPWRQTLIHFAGMAYQGPPLDGPLRLDVVFTMPRPKAHYRIRARLPQELRSEAPMFHTSAPDTTKLLRAVEDALTGIVWRDDRQIAVQYVTKFYGDRPGANITVGTLDDDAYQMLKGMANEPGQEDR